MNVAGLIPRPRAAGFSWKIGIGVAWLVLTLALAVWWLIFGLQQAERLGRIGQAAPLGVAPKIGQEISREIGQEIGQEMARQHRMLLSEGVFLILLLLGGGTALLYYIYTEMRRARRVQEFFASFTHDMKTSLASLRLQVESLEADLETQRDPVSRAGAAIGPLDAKLLRRIKKDTVRLELQLENSLLLASPDDGDRILLEDLALAPILDSMFYQWPELTIVRGGLTTDALLVRADRRGLESILKNFMQNSVVHGRATQVEITAKIQGGRVRLRLQDNGRGFRGDRKRLGQMFHRHTSSSGSGLGLYLAATLVRRMQGQLRICESDSGFCVEIELPAGGAPSSNSVVSGPPPNGGVK